MAKKSSRDVIAGGAAVIISGDDTSFRGVLTSAEKRLKAFGQATVMMGAKLAGLGLSLGLGLAAATKRFADAGSAIDDISQRTGDTASNISAMAYAAKLSGSSIEDLEGGLSKMSTTIAGALAGEKTAVKLLSDLGLSASKLKGKLPTDQFDIFADALLKITDNDKKIDLVKSVFGKAGTQLIPLLNQGSAGIAKLRKEAEALGLVMSNEDAAAAAKLGDSLDMLYGAINGVVNKVGAALAPVMTAAIDYFVKGAAAVSKFVDQNRALAPQAATIIAGITGIGVALSLLGVSIYVTGPAIALGMGVATIAYYGFASASYVVNTAVAVASAALKSLVVVTWATSAAYKVLMLPRPLCLRLPRLRAVWHSEPCPSRLEYL